MTVTLCRTRLRLTPAIKIMMFLARAMTVSRKPGMGGGYAVFPAAHIRQLAREIASARLLYLPEGLGAAASCQRRTNRACCSGAVALTGRFGRPGTNNGNWPYGTPYGVPLLPVGRIRQNLYSLRYLWTDAIQHPEKMTATTTMGVKGADRLNRD